MSNLLGALHKLRTAEHAVCRACLCSFCAATIARNKPRQKIGLPSAELREILVCGGYILPMALCKLLNSSTLEAAHILQR